MKKRSSNKLRLLFIAIGIVRGFVFTFIPMFVTRPDTTQLDAIISGQSATIDDLTTKLSADERDTFVMPDGKQLGCFPYYLKDNKMQSGAKLTSITISDAGVNYHLCNETLECIKYKEYADSDDIPADGRECLKEGSSYDQDCFDTSIAGTEQQIKDSLCLK